MESLLAKKAATYPVDIYECFNEFLPTYINYLAVFFLF
jgi:hypothetical protein